MIATVYNATNIFLLDLMPEWGGVGFKAKVEMVSQFSAGLSNREGRRPFAQTLRFSSVSFALLLYGGDARRFYGAMRAYQKQPIVIPLWSAAVAWPDRASATINGGLKLVYRMVSDGPLIQFEIYEAAPVVMVPLATDIVVPLLWGRLDKREAQWLSSDALSVQIEFAEQSPASYAITPAVAGWTAGPRPSVAYAAGPDLLPFTVDFDQATNAFTIDVIREQLGFGRQPAETLYPQAVAREQDLGHSLEGADIGKLLRFFLDHGSGRSFWASNWVGAVRLTADAAAGDTVLHVEDSYAVKAGDWLAARVSPGIDGVPAYAQVQSVTSNTVTLVAAFGVALYESSSLVSHLILARWTRPMLELQWANLNVALARLPLREVAEEYAPAADETLGTTIGLLPPRCYLYEFARTLGGVTYTDRYTSFEIDLTYGGHTYTSEKIQHGEITQGLLLDRDECEVTTDVFTGEALLNVATATMEAPLLMEIIEAEVVAGAAVNATVIFSGEVAKASVRGNRLVGKGLSAGTMFDRKVTRPRFQPGCNNAIYDAGCTLQKADWKFTAIMQDPGAVGYPFTFILNTLAGSGARAIASLAAGSVFVNWFAGGWIELGGGASLNRRSILASSAVVAGVVTLTLDRDPNPFPAIGDAVNLFPGCDGRMQTCKAYDAAKNPEGKFNNYDNIFAHPFMPIANPMALNAVKPAGGGKK